MDEQQQSVPGHSEQLEEKCRVVCDSRVAGKVNHLIHSWTGDLTKRVHHAHLLERRLRRRGSDAAFAKVLAKLGAAIKPSQLQA